MPKRFYESLNVLSIISVLTLQIANADLALTADATPAPEACTEKGPPSREGLNFLYDYFEANATDAGRNYLKAVNDFHMDKKVFDNITGGRYEAALGDIDYTLRHFPNHPMALQLVSVVAILSKNSVRAVAYFEKAIGLYPCHSLTHAQYGSFLVGIGNFEKGIEKLHYAVRLDPKLIAGHVGLAKAYEKKGDVKSAREAAERAKELGYNGKFSAEDLGK